MFSALISLIIIPMLANAQCLVLSTTCKVCTAPITKPSEISLNNCHISSNMTHLIPTLSGSLDVPKLAQEWFIFSRSFSGPQIQSFCPLTVARVTDINTLYDVTNAQASAIMNSYQGCRFNADSYFNVYSDLNRAFKNDTEALKQHYLTIGIKERRSPCGVPRCTFDAAEYYKTNPDVKAASIDALTHYITYGLTENRAIRTCVNSKVDTTGWRMNDAKTKYRTLGCYLAMAHRDAKQPGPLSDLGFSVLNSWKLDISVPEVINSLSRLLKVIENPRDSLARIERILEQTNGKNPFSSELHQFTQFYVAARYFSSRPKLDQNRANERFTYIMWTLLPSDRLTLDQKVKYANYQLNPEKSLTPRQILGSTFALDTLKLTCPTHNSYLTASCLVYIAINCQSDRNMCESSFRQIQTVAWQQQAAAAFDIVCKDFNASRQFSGMCTSPYRSWIYV